MHNRLYPVLLSLLTLGLTGCLVHRYGDARLQKNSDAFSITSDRLTLNPVPLDAAAKHVQQARDLPFPIYPAYLVVPITPAEAELKQNFPWEKTRLRVEFRSPEGTTFFSNEVALAASRPGRSPGTRHQLQVQFGPVSRESWKAPENLPHHTTYDVIVTVLEPSKNKNHRATLYADTYVR